MKTLFYSCKEYEIPFLKKYEPYNIAASYIAKPLRAGTVHLAKGYDAISLFSRDDASKDILQLIKSFGVKYIATRSTGYNHIDVDYCKQNEIKVAHVPDYSPHAIAEHAILLILALNRRLISAHYRIQQNNFSLSGLLGYNLGDQRVGVIGTGRIGQALIHILNGFDSYVLAYDIFPDSSLQQKLDFDYVDLDTLLSTSDIISLHIPLTEQTHYFIDTTTINKMKPGVILINTSRGKLINTQSVINALVTNHIAALGIDVYEREHDIFFEDRSEKPFIDPVFKYLQARDNVLITGHQAFFTETALDNIAQATWRNLTCFYTRHTSPNFLT